MPTVFPYGPYRFFFYSNEGNEPVHIHVAAGDSLAKYWIEPVELASSVGFGAHDLARIRDLVVENVELVKEKWDDDFGSL